jgi:DNA-binding NtrC family response regulator
MAKMLLLGNGSPMVEAVEAALSSAGHAVTTVRTAAEVREILRRESFASLFIADVEPDAESAIVDIAVEAEQRGVRAVVMTTSARRLETLRAKGLVCFEPPSPPGDLIEAVQGRL